MATLFNSQLSTFLPRNEFFTDDETDLSRNGLSETDSLNLSQFSLSISQQSNSPSNGPHLSPSSVPPSQPSNDSIVSRYMELIERRTIPGIKSIDELTKSNLKEREEAIGCVFGIVRSVRDSRGTKFKYVTLVDPTNETGIELETFGTTEKIAVGQMMKSCNLKIQRTGSTFAFMFTPATKNSFFPLFSYNYDSPMGDERNKALTETRFCYPEDREICYLLEKWFSLKILNGIRLSHLPKPGEFVDICCQVLAYNKSPLCMNAVIWDTSKPNYKPLFGPDGRPPLGLDCINYDYFHVAYEKYFALTVWKEESYDQAQHYDTFKCIDLTSGDDLVVLFNLQVVEDTNHPGKVSLVMRSCRKWGKAVRLCHRNSILGRMFLHRCQEYRKEFRRKLGLSESNDVEKPKPPKTPFKQTPSKSTDASTTKARDLIVNLSEASISQIKKRDSVQNRLSDPKPSTRSGPVKRLNFSEESRQDNQASSSDLNVSEVQTSTLQPESIISNKDPSATAQKRKRKAADQLLTQKLPAIYNEPLPSTSGYSLRSQRRITASSAKLNQQSTKESEVNKLTRLQTKAAKYLNWDALLSNGLAGLRLLHEVLEESDLRDEASPLTREEHIEYIRLAIDHLENKKRTKSPSKKSPARKLLPTKSSPTTMSHQQSSEKPNDSDSDTADETFPIIDRVKFYTT